VHVLITGVTGQDGSYLAQQACAMGHSVSGLMDPREPIPPYLLGPGGQPLCHLEPCEMADPAMFRKALRALRPNRVFHLAAMSFPPSCDKDEAVSQQVNVTSVEVLLEWLHRDSPASRALVCASSAVFGSSPAPLDETSPEQPVNLYGRQKQRVRLLARQARASGLFVACAIPFNHESERRPELFALAKICFSAARIARGTQARLDLGNVEPVRDWGYAPEYTQAMWWMLDLEHANELVLATGEGHSVRELVDCAFAEAGISPQDYVQHDPVLARGAEINTSIGNPARALEELNWEAQTKFDALVRRLVQYALQR
jgi:GDPmannose 4,6-dehydratase